MVRVVALKTTHRSSRRFLEGRRSPAGSSTRASSRSTTWAFFQTGSRSTPCASSSRARCATSCASRRRAPAGRWRACARFSCIFAARSRMRTNAASCTATSSRRTSSSATTARVHAADGGSPSALARPRRTPNHSRTLGSRRVHLTAHGAVVGTPGYMAPEQAYPNVAVPVDHRADLFAMAILGHLMGQRAFGGTELMAAATNRLAGAAAAARAHRRLSHRAVGAVPAAVSKRPRTGRSRPEGIAAEVEAHLEGDKERERRRAEAERLVAAAAEPLARWRASTAEKERITHEARALAANVKAWDPIYCKRPAWAREDRASIRDVAAARALAEVERLYAQALGHDPSFYGSPACARRPVPGSRRGGRERPPRGRPHLQRVAGAGPRRRTRGGAALRRRRADDCQRPARSVGDALPLRGAGPRPGPRRAACAGAHPGRRVAPGAGALARGAAATRDGARCATHSSSAAARATMRTCASSPRRRLAKGSSTSPAARSSSAAMPKRRSRSPVPRWWCPTSRSRACRSRSANICATSTSSGSAIRRRRRAPPRATTPATVSMCAAKARAGCRAAS